MNCRNICFISVLFDILLDSHGFNSFMKLQIAMLAHWIAIIQTGACCATYTGPMGVQRAGAWLVRGWHVAGTGWRTADVH